MYDIYDTLFREEADGSYVPNLCTEYSFNEDGTELTMKLVEGVKFQNGDVMTVDDVVFHFKYLHCVIILQRNLPVA